MGEKERIIENTNIAPLNINLDDDYRFLGDAYYGKGGFKNGDYLVPHTRETIDRFTRRKMLSPYFNYVKPCVNSRVEPIFEKYPVREYGGAAEIDIFLKNVDGKGTALERFMLQVAVSAKLHGSSFIVVDNFTELPTSAEQMIKERKFPYCYRLGRNKVKEVFLDQFGQVVQITYDTKENVIGKDGQVTNETISWTWTKDTWRKAYRSQIEEGNNKIGMVPVINVLGTGLFDEDEPTKPLSEFYQIARANLALYNAVSELRNRNRDQAFSIISYPLSDDQEPKDLEDIVVSTTDMLLYKGNSGKSPEYITPGSEPSTILMDEIKMYIEEIYRMAERSNVTGVVGQQSGIAKEWDNKALNQTLKEFAKVLEEAEERIVSIFCKYLNKDIKFNSTYNNDFGINDTTSLLDNITAALSMDIGVKFNIAAKKKVVDLILPEEDDKVLNDIKAEIDGNALDKLESGKEDKLNIGSV